MMMLTMLPIAAANKYDNPDTLVVSRDGTGEFRTIDEVKEELEKNLKKIKI